jgi:hypothetical protein
LCRCAAGAYGPSVRCSEPTSAARALASETSTTSESAQSTDEQALRVTPAELALDGDWRIGTGAPPPKPLSFILIGKFLDAEGSATQAGLCIRAGVTIAPGGQAV